MVILNYFSEMNRQVMIKENVVEKVVCLLWSKNPKVREHIRAALKFFSPNQSAYGDSAMATRWMPSLTEICIFQIRHTIGRKKVKRSVVELLPITLAECIMEYRKIKE